MEVPVRDTVAGWSSTVAMDEGGHTASAKGRAESADLADGSPKELGGLGHQQLAAIKSMEDPQALLGAVRQRDHASPGSSPPGEDIFADLLGRTKSLNCHNMGSCILTARQRHSTIGCCPRVGVFPHLR